MSRAPHYIAEDWVPYRRARIQFRAVAAFLSLVVLAFLLRWQFDRFGGELGSWLIAAVVATLLFLFMLMRFLRWPCPRCEKPFHMRGWSANLLNKECRNCAITIGADARGSGLVVER